MSVALPAVTEWNRFYWTSGSDGKLRLQSCGTCGSLLSHGRTHGMGLVHEAITQLRGAAGPRQVEGAATAVVSSGGLTPGGVILFRVDD